MNPDPDAKLVSACQSSANAGLEGPFRELYDRYKDRVYNVCFRTTGNPTDALDAAQETFGIVFRRIREFRFQSRFSSWVYRIAVNASIDLKRRSRTRRFASLEAVQEAGDAEGGRFEVYDDSAEMPSQVVSRRELEDEVQRAILRLSDKLQQVIVLRYVENLSYEELAEVLDISLGTVKSRLSRAHEALNRELTPVLDRHYLG